MIYAAILAGGVGKRMGYSNMPKQFLDICEKPIIVHTIEQFMCHSRIDKIVIAVTESWELHTKELIKNHIGETDRVIVTKGGQDRNETIIRAISAIEKNFGIKDDDIIVTHDAVRPFVTHRIINDNIAAAIKYGACDTVIPATDTIVVSNDDEFIAEIPDRKPLFFGQTPQSFNIKLLLDNFNKLNDDQKSVLTDACKICNLNGIAVKNVTGEPFNLKITTSFDLKIANAIVCGGLNDK